MIRNENFPVYLMVDGVRTTCGAVEAGTRVVFRFHAPRRMAVKNIKAVLVPDGMPEDGIYADTVRRLFPDDSEAVADSSAGKTERSPESIALCPEWVGIEKGDDIYEAEVTVRYCGLYFLRAEIFHSYGGDFVEKQLTVYRKGWHIPDWLIDGVMYQIFPDRFAKSENITPAVKPYAEINGDWDGGTPKFAAKPGDPLDNNEFFGGNLYGVIEKLDYIQSLGVNIIYLNPIFEAYSNHKYDTADYTKVDGMFGGDAALDKLIDECHKRGIRILLDGVFNHTGSDSVYFNAEGRYDSVGAVNSKDSPYYDWYRFKKYPDSYDSWWGVKILPTLNKDSRSLREFISGETGVIRRWMKRGIDGWRLDVVDELPDSMVAEMNAAALAERDDAILLGEVWEDASNKVAYGQRRKYFQGYELASVMNYPFREAIIDFVLGGDAKKIADHVAVQVERYPREVTLAQMNFLGTHDTERILCMLSDAKTAGMRNAELAVHKLTPLQREVAIKRLKMAAALLYALPGVPCTYYGDEVGMEGWRDPFNRRPFPWGRENTGILEFYRVLGNIRRSEGDLRRGDFKVVSAKNGVFVFSRGEITVVANCSAEAYTVSKCAPFSDIISGTKAERAVSGRFEAFVLPKTVAYFKKS